MQKSDKNLQSISPTVRGQMLIKVDDNSDTILCILRVLKSFIPL